MNDCEPTDGMTEAIYSLMEQALSALQDVARFSNGDVMSAAMHLMVDAGMFQVESGNCTREELIKDICAAARDTVMEWTPDIEVHTVVGNSVVQ